MANNQSSLAFTSFGVASILDKYLDNGVFPNGKRESIKRAISMMSEGIAGLRYRLHGKFIPSPNQINNGNHFLDFIKKVEKINFCTIEDYLHRFERMQETLQGFTDNVKPDKEAVKEARETFYLLADFFIDNA